MSKTYWVYIMTNDFRNVMYIGVTNNLERRDAEHKSGTIPGFTQKYKVHRLVYFEHTASVEDAITREKQLKGWKRDRKDALVSGFNPEWRDLSPNPDLCPFPQKITKPCHPESLGEGPPLTSGRVLKVPVVLNGKSARGGPSAAPQDDKEFLCP